jgi:hypothetical protein
MNRFANSAVTAAASLVIALSILTAVIAAVSPGADGSLERSFEQEKEIGLEALNEREQFVAHTRACLEKSGSMAQLSDCLDAEYDARRAMEARLRPVKSRQESIEDML